MVRIPTRNTEVPCFASMFNYIFNSQLCVSLYIVLCIVLCIIAIKQLLPLTLFAPTIAGPQTNITLSSWLLYCNTPYSCSIFGCVWYCWEPWGNMADPADGHASAHYPWQSSPLFNSHTRQHHPCSCCNALYCPCTSTLGGQAAPRVASSTQHQAKIPHLVVFAAADCDRNDGAEALTKEGHYLAMVSLTNILIQ